MSVTGLGRKSIGQDRECHLGRYFLERLSEELCRPHTGLQRAERIQSLTSRPELENSLGHEQTRLQHQGRVRFTPLNADEAQRKAICPLVRELLAKPPESSEQIRNTPANPTAQ